MNVDLGRYDNSLYDPGRGSIIRFLWYVVNAFCFSSYLLPLYAIKRTLLRMFGARIGKNVVIKPNVNIKYPWNVEIGDHVWIGEGVWLDSLGTIKIGSNVCISQDAYLCTGSHDWSRRDFPLIVKSIKINDGAWISARAVVMPGTVLEQNVVITAGSVISGSTTQNGVYTGNPAKYVKQRSIREVTAP